MDTSKGDPKVTYILLNDCPVKESYKVPSLPSYLCLQESQIPGAGLGVFTTETLEEEHTFGPFEDLENASVWFGYISMSAIPGQHNVVCGKFDGCFYYLTARKILAGEELVLERSLYPDRMPTAVDNSINGNSLPALSTKQLQAEEFTFSCHECGKTYDDIKDLKLHVSMCKYLQTHTEELSFQCTACGMAFCDPRNLSIHVNDHRLKNTFRCSKCNLEFPHFNLLFDHSHCHNESKEQRLHCLTCRRVFRKHSTLVNHLWSSHKLLVNKFPET